MNVLFRLVVTGAALAAGLGAAAPASASVTYDPGTKKGFAGSGDVRRAFGWTDATLTAKASTLVFNHDFWTDDTYSVTCGARVVPVRHHREFGRYELWNAALRDTGRGAATGYAAKLTGFWITGPKMGISGTSVGPAVGHPCPDGRAGRTTKVRLVSTTTGWALSVSSGNNNRRLVTG